MYYNKFSQIGYDFREMIHNKKKRKKMLSKNYYFCESGRFIANNHYSPVIFERKML